MDLMILKSLYLLDTLLIGIYLNLHYIYNINSLLSE